MSTFKVEDECKCPRVAWKVARLSDEINDLIRFECTPEVLRGELKRFEEEFMASAVIELVHPPISELKPRKEKVYDQTGV